MPNQWVDVQLSFYIGPHVQRISNGSLMRGGKMNVLSADGRNATVLPAVLGGTHSCPQLGDIDDLDGVATA